MRKLTGICVLCAWACVEQSSDVPTEDDLRIIKQNVLTAAPAPKFPVNAELDGGKVVYLGMDVEGGVLIPGKAVKVTHYWKAAQAVGDDWKLFVHLGGGDSHQSYVNLDHVPVRGRYKVSQWKAGEIVRDEHSVTLPKAWKGTEANIYVGLWRGSERMKITKGPSDGKDRVLAAKVPVSGAGAAAEPRKRYVARRVATPPVIDGKLDDAAWKDVPTTDAFVGSLDGAAADKRTEARVVWDDTHVYVAFEVEDTDAASSFTKQDDSLWTQDAVEMFIDADGDGKDYIELEVNPGGVLFDSYLPEYRKNENDWSSGAKVAVKVDGTYNKRDDTDKGWTVEMALPMAAAKARSTDALELPPRVGGMWRVNFFRMDKPKDGPQVATAWSPPLVGDFHALGRFGDLVFGDAQGQVAAPVKAILAPARALIAPAALAPKAGAATAAKATAPAAKK